MFDKVSVLSCRVCLTTDPSPAKVTMNSENGWLELIEYCFGLHINPEEQAKTLCKECADSIQKFAKFKEECLKSDAFWKSNMYLNHKDNVKLSLNKDDVVVKTENDHYSDNLESDIEKLFGLLDNNWNCSQEHLPEVTNSASIDDNNRMIETDIPHCNIKKEECESKDASCRQSVNSSQDIDFSGKKSKQTNILKRKKKSNVKEELSCKCGSQFKMKKDYTNHTKKCKANKFYDTQNTNPETCGLCEFSSQDGDVSTLVKHLDNHYVRNDLQCGLCAYTARDFAEMVYHRYTHQNTKYCNSKSVLYCVKCYRVFSHARSLQFHFRTEHMKKKGGLCSFCGIELRNLETWHRHELRKHSNQIERASASTKKIFICDCCGLTFVYRNEIVAHLQQRAGASKAVCDKCGKDFKRKSNLLSHYKIKHTKPDMVKCPKCPRTMSRYLLKKHITTWHTEEKYVCEICSKKIRTKPNLKYHMLTHTNEKPFKCDECNLAYRTKSLLTLHKLRHTGIKPHECPICFKRFLRSLELRKHSLMHTKVRPEKCEQCSISIHDKRQMLEHVKGPPCG